MLNVTNWLAVTAAAEVELAKPTPPQARAPADPPVVTPEPRVSPAIERFGALVVGEKGEFPKPVTPFTSHPISVTVLVPPPPPIGLIVVESLAVLLAAFVSPPPDNEAMLVMLAGALEATLTVSVIGG